MKKEIKKKMNDSFSELFGFVCECKDPRATHTRPGLDGRWGQCFIRECKCQEYKMDNLKFLEEKSRDEKEIQMLGLDPILKGAADNAHRVIIRTKSGDVVSGYIRLEPCYLVVKISDDQLTHLGYADIESVTL